jgi:hypothetical protein
VLIRGEEREEKEKKKKSNGHRCKLETHLDNPKK